MKKKLRCAVDFQEMIDAHFGKLNKLLQLEEKEDGDRFRAEFLDKKPEEREKSGKAILFLSLLGLHYNPSGQRLLTFGYPNNKWLPRYSLGPGDVVSLSSVRIPVSECPVGTVFEKDKLKITVAFSSKIPGWVGREDIYHLNMAANRTTYDRMYQALREIGGAKHSQPARIRDISIGLRKPEFKDPVKPETVGFFDTKLNDLQKLAVCKALESEEVLLVHGPPGTGKTRVLVEVIRQAKKNQEAVLVSAPSNAACDHIVECLANEDVPVTRLGHPARISEKIREHTLGYQLVRHPLTKLIEQNEARLEQLLKQNERRQDRRVMSREKKDEMFGEIRHLRTDIRELKAQIFRMVWNQSDVVVATHTVCGEPLIKEKTFDWVIVDEATQGIEPATWIPISHAGRLILAGDHCQLPPTVMSRRTGPDSLSFTLFERFHKHLPEESKVRLEVQYRMHEDIMNFSSKEFYDGKLSAHSSVIKHLLTDLPKVRKEDLTERPVVFLDTAGLGYEDNEEQGSGSRFNPEEAKLVTKEYFRLVEAGIPPGQIAIISPYSAQVKLIAGRIFEKAQADPSKNYEATEIDSVDAFQGREKEAVIVSLVRCNMEGQLGFLKDTRRMNVAMTRAKRKLIVIGDSATLATIPFYKNFIDYVEKIGSYASAWEYVS